MTLLLTEAVWAFLDHCRIAKCLSNHTLRAYESDLGQFAVNPSTSPPNAMMKQALGLLLDSLASVWVPWAKNGRVWHPC